MQQQMNQPAPQMFGPGVDPHKQFKSEAENLAVVAHSYTLDGVEDRLLQSVKM